VAAQGTFLVQGTPVDGMPGFRSTVRIVGYGMTPLGKLRQPASVLMQSALEKALASSGLQLKDLDGLIAVPSLSHPHFMEAHFLATKVGLLPQKNVTVRTLDTGGAGPVTGLLEAARMVRTERCHAVAVVAGDAVASMDTRSFLERADAGCRDPVAPLPSPCIPHGYDRVAQWQLEMGSVTREQLASGHPRTMLSRPTRSVSTAGGFLLLAPTVPAVPSRFAAPSTLLYPSPRTHSTACSPAALSFACSLPHRSPCEPLSAGSGSRAHEPAGIAPSARTHPRATLARRGARGGVNRSTDWQARVRSEGGRRGVCDRRRLRIC